VTDVLQLARPEIRRLAPAGAALSGADTAVRLHANENPWPDEADIPPVALNRYVDGQPAPLVAALAAHYGVDASNVLVTRGSDEGIDLLVRAFCRAGEDQVLVCPPTFGMYGFSASIQGAEVVAVPLAADFVLDAAALADRWTPATKLVFLCSPNNPTGNLLQAAAIECVLASIAGRAIVVLDEAYVEFSGHPGLLHLLGRHHGLVILRTLSKAHGLAGARCGVALAAPALIDLLGRMMPPYALPGPSVAAALEALRPERLARTRRRISELVAERERLQAALTSAPGVVRTWPSEGNFVLVQFRDAGRALAAASREGLLLRNFPRQPRLEGCLRITVGTHEANDRLLGALAAA